MPLIGPNGEPVSLSPKESNMEPIDWNKAIELMDGEPREHWVHGEAVWVGVKGNHVGFYTDRQGCIGGVQVVRNRKEPVKHVYYLYFNEADKGASLYAHNNYSPLFKPSMAKILIWVENGKTQVEVCDD